MNTADILKGIVVFQNKLSGYVSFIPYLDDPLLFTKEDILIP